MKECGKVVKKLYKSYFKKILKLTVQSKPLQLIFALKTLLSYTYIL